MASPLKILVIDDEPLALRRLRLLLDRIDDIDIVGEALSGDAALRLIGAVRPDVLLLDVRMTGMSGLDLAEALDRENAPVVIFITAFASHAARAFDLKAVDYVLKPVALDRLSEALQKARRTIAATQAENRIVELHEMISALRREARTRAEGHDDEIWAEQRGQFVRVLRTDIDWVEAERDYVRLHSGTNRYLLRDTISSLHERLRSDDYVRVRRGALVRLDRVSAIRRAGPGDYRIILSNGAEVRVGRTYVRAVRKMLAPGVPGPAAVSDR